MTDASGAPSFSARIKLFLAEDTLREFDRGDARRAGKARECCRDSFLDGVLLFCGKKEKRGVRLTFESEATAAFLREALLCRFGKEAESAEADGASLYLPPLLLAAWQKKIGEPKLACPRCAQFFLRGAFLSCGTVQDPARGYHAAFTCRDGREAILRSVCPVLADAPVQPKREGVFSLYLKNSASIEDLLSYMGANTFTFALINAKAEKSIRNDVNRRQNFDEANLRRAVDHVQRVLEAIRYLKKVKAYDALPENLKSASNLVLTFPDASLRELCEKSEEPLSKSGLEHRFRRILDRAEERKKKK